MTTVVISGLAVLAALVVVLAAVAVHGVGNLGRGMEVYWQEQWAVYHPDKTPPDLPMRRAGSGLGKEGGGGGSGRGSVGGSYYTKGSGSKGSYRKSVSGSGNGSGNGSGSGVGSSSNAGGSRSRVGSQRGRGRGPDEALPVGTSAAHMKAMGAGVSRWDNRSRALQQQSSSQSAAAKNSDGHRASSPKSV